MAEEIGGFGDFGVFGFYPNKSITTGEGGMVITRDRQLAETIRALRNQGRRPADGWLDHRCSVTTTGSLKSTALSASRK